MGIDLSTVDSLEHKLPFKCFVFLFEFTFSRKSLKSGHGGITQRIHGFILGLQILEKL